MDTARQKTLDRNALYKEHSQTIDSLRDALLRELTSLVDEFSLNERRAGAVAAYMNDRGNNAETNLCLDNQPFLSTYCFFKVTLFRFLLRNSYSLPTTLSLILGIIRWRLKRSVDDLSYTDLPAQLFENPFVFFHKQDKIQRPVLVINVQYLPTFNSSEFTEQLRPFMILIM
jgi:hypothetical protein